MIDEMNTSNIYRYLAGCYLGFSITYFGNINPFQWQFYAILIPVIFLYTRPLFLKNKRDKGMNLIINMKSGNRITVNDDNYRDLNRVRSEIMRKIIRSDDKWMVLIIVPERHFILLSEIESITIDK